MFKKIAENLIARPKISWELIVSNGQVCLLLMFQIFLWIPVVSSALTGTLLIIYGILWIIQGVSWIIQGVSLLFIENRTTSVSIGSGLIIASGCSIIGLGLAMLLPLMVEVDWMLRMAGIFYSLAFFVWIFVILKLAPIITRGLLIGVVFCIIAVGYALVCNVLLVISALVPNVSHITAHWEKAIKAIGYIVSGSAVVGWTLFVMRKTAPTNFKILVPVFIILGIIYIAFGIVMITVLTFR